MDFSQSWTLIRFLKEKLGNSIFLSGESCLLNLNKEYGRIGELTVCVSSPLSFEAIKKKLQKLGIERSFICEKKNFLLIVTKNSEVIRIVKYNTGLELNRLHSMLPWPLCLKYYASDDLVLQYKHDELSFNSPKVLPTSLFYYPEEIFMKLIRISYDINSKVRFDGYPLSDLDHVVDYRILGVEMDQVLMSHFAGDILRKYNRFNILNPICKELSQMLRIPQKKNREKLNLFEHSVQVTENCAPNLIARWASLFHDVGKIHTMKYSKLTGKYTFRNHEVVGSKIAKEVLNRFGHYSISERVSNLVRLHMMPGQYQRTPNWTQEAIQRLKKAAHGDEILLIELGIADKLAAQKNIKTLQNLHNLRNKMHDVAFVNSEVTKISNNMIKL